MFYYISSRNYFIFFSVQKYKIFYPINKNLFLTMHLNPQSDFLLHMTHFWTNCNFIWVILKNQNHVRNQKSLKNPQVSSIWIKNCFNFISWYKYLLLGDFLGFLVTNMIVIFQNDPKIPNNKFQVNPSDFQLFRLLRLLNILPRKTVICFKWSILFLFFSFLYWRIF